MTDDPADQAVLHLSKRDAAIVAAALRQYEPYWSPDDPAHAEQLSDLVRDIARLLGELRSHVPNPPRSPMGAH